MKKSYPEHYRLPTEGTLVQHLVGKEQGLVPAGSLVLRQTAEYITDIIGNKDVRRIDAQLRKTMHGMDAAGYAIAGLDAVQIGESARIALVPHPTEKGEMLTVINGSIENHPDAKLGPLVPHGCHSGNEVFAKLRVSETHTLRGYDINGEPIELERAGFHAVVDRHELWHEEGVRAMDIAVAENIQLDYRPPEEKQAYRDFFDGPDGYGQNPELPDWHLAYPPDQWQAVELGEFTLMQFID